MSLFNLFRSIHGLAIKFYPQHVQLTGSLTGAVLLSYLLRQMAYHKTDAIFNTDKEIILATGLTRKQLLNARDKMRASGLLETTREGNADGRLTYKICEEKAEERLGRLCRKGKTSYAERVKPVMPKGHNPLREPVNTEENKVEDPAGGGLGIPKTSAKIQRLYHAKWRDKYKRQHTKLSGTEASILKDVWITIGANVPEARRVLDNFFNCDDKFFHGHSPRFLRSHLDKWIVDPPPRQQPRSRFNGNGYNGYNGGNGHPAETVPAPTCRILTTNTPIED